MTKIKNKNKTSEGNVLTKRLTKLEQYVNTHKGDVKYRVLYNSITLGSSGAIYYLSPLAQNDDASTRTGDVVNLQSVEVCYNMQLTKTANVRVLVFRDKMNNGTSPSVNDVLDSTDVIAPLNYLNFTVQKRFTLLHDKTEHFTTGGILTTTGHKNITQRVKVRYMDAGGTITSALSNQIFALVICDTVTAGAMALYTRIFYTDE